MKAMILAAGLGSRMQPLTRARPKPTLPILDRPMLRVLVEHLAAQGVREVVVNAHAHPEQLRAALEAAPIPVRYSIEPKLTFENVFEVSHAVRDIPDERIRTASPYNCGSIR